MSMRQSIPLWFKVCCGLLAVFVIALGFSVYWLFSVS